MGLQNYQLEQPKDWQEFERLCHWVWREILKDPYAQMNGRQGQKQAGVDIYGEDLGTKKLHAVQCKGKDAHYGKPVTENELRQEVSKALTFSPRHPDVFVLATTAPRDKNIQTVARQITVEIKPFTSMKVIVFGWEDICSRIAQYPNIIDEFFPHHSNATKELIFGMGRIYEEVSEIKAVLIAPNETNIKLFDRDQVKKYFDAGSNGLLSWPRTLKSNDHWIDRKEEQDILVNFDTDLHSSSIILGEPGTGKSALLSKIAQSLIDDNELVLAIKADQLDHSVNNFQSLGLALGLPGPADECLRVASKFGTVFLVVDQLDTLSELVDVKTNRLSVLLNLIRKMSFEPNIHILASSRPFEFNYDARLSAINAYKIQLLTLEWRIVDEVLKSNGIQIMDADESFKSFLCRPSNLNFYLSYLKSNPQKYFLSHIELYEDLWNTSLGKGANKIRRAEFLLQTASVMTEDAKQALPIARYDNEAEDIDWLVAAGILVKNENKKSFSFAHQTLQAFIWTRSFVKQNSSLKSFIIAHQDNLNVRPRLSTALFYLREADISEYNKQITLILSTDIMLIRRHVVHLVIQSVGVHHDPNSDEIKLLKTLVEDDYYKGRICRAISGKELWFDSFEVDILPKLMLGNSSTKFMASGILSSALSRRFDAVLNLIGLYWRSSDDLNYIYNILQTASEWDDRLLELAKDLVISPSINSHIPASLFHYIQQNSPKIALKLTAYYFSHKLRNIIETAPPTPPCLPSDATEIEQYTYNLKHDPKARFEGLLDFGSGWHNLVKVAEQAPITFMEEFWPFFLQVCKHTKYDRYWEANSYSDCSGNSFHLSDEGKDFRSNYFCESLEQAMKLFARNCKRDFLNMYNSAKEIEVLPVQRILAKGLCEIANEEPLFVLAQLMDDKRRLKLGSAMGDYYSGTKELISSLCEHLDIANLQILEQYLSSYNDRDLITNITVEARQSYISYNRKVRYQLFSAIGINKRSDFVKKIIAEEERAFGDKIKKGSNMGYSGLTRQVSPMSLKQLEKAKDDDIVKCFQAFPDNHDRDWRDSSTYVGAMEFGRTFETFSEKNPERAIAIIGRLKLENKLSVGHGLVGLSKSDVSLAQLLELINSLTTEFASADFYDDSARAIKNKISEDISLSPKWLKKIEGWLSILSQRNPDLDTDENDNEQKEGKVEGILWGHGKMYGIPGGNYQILDCLTLGYLLRKEPLTTHWADFIVKYINQGDSLSIWLTFLFAIFPRAIVVCNAKDVERIIDAIIEAYPVVVARIEIAFTLAESIKKVEDNKLFEWLDFFVKKDSSQSLQIYGELLGIKWIISPESEETISRINGIIIANNTFALCGLAFTLKNIWKYRKPLITDLYVRLISIKNKNLSKVLLGILQSNDLEPSEELNRILDAFINNRTLEQSDEHDSYILHCILPLTTVEPLRIAQICKDVISVHNQNLGDISSAAASGTSDLITIAITLHNLGCQYQKIGLDLFEKLIDIDAYQIQEALVKIDLVPRIRVVA